MKLNTAQVARTVSQLQVEALPEDHPLVLLSYIDFIK